MFLIPPLQEVIQSEAPVSRKGKSPMRRQRSDFSSSSIAEIDALCCPLTLETFHDPVILLGDGHTYERVRTYTLFVFFVILFIFRKELQNGSVRTMRRR